MTFPFRCNVLPLGKLETIYFFNFYNRTHINLANFHIFHNIRMYIFLFFHCGFCFSQRFFIIENFHTFSGHAPKVFSLGHVNVACKYFIFHAWKAIKRETRKFQKIYFFEWRKPNSNTICWKLKRIKTFRKALLNHTHTHTHDRIIFYIFEIFYCEIVLEG